MTVAQHTLPPGLQDDGGCNIEVEDNVCNTFLGTSALVDGSMTSSFCVNGSADSVSIAFALSGVTPPSIARVEVSLLTCPGSESTNVILYSLSFFRDSESDMPLTNSMDVLCSTAQNVTLSLQPPVQGFFLLEFSNAAIKVAEVQFFDNTPSSSCPPPVLATSPPPVLTTPTTSRPPVLAEPTTSSPPVPATDSPPTPVAQTSNPLILSTSTPSPSQSPPSQSPLPNDDDQPSIGLIVGVVIAAVVALIAIILAVFFICYLMSIRRKQKQSQVEKLQNVMLEHKSIELTGYQETNQEEIHNRRYDTVALKPQPVKNVQRPTPSEIHESIDNRNYAQIPNVQRKADKAPLVMQFSDISSPGYSALAATSGNGELNRKTQPANAAISDSHAEISTAKPLSPKLRAEAQSSKATKEQEEVEQPQQVYSVVQKEAPPSIPQKSQELADYLASQSVEYPLDSDEYSVPSQVRATTLPAQSRQAAHQSVKLATLSKPAFDGMQVNLSYERVDMPSEGPTSDNIYAEPGSPDEPATPVLYDTVYSEPIKPSLFTSEYSEPDLAEELHPYAPIYTMPEIPPQSDDSLPEVTSDNIREVRRLGRGQFGEVILAETVGLSPKDLKMSDSHDKGKVLVAVKKLKQTAPKSMQETFEKECNFMGRLRDANVIRILAVCKGSVPFIVMEYMENGDLNQYLQRYSSVTPEILDDSQISSDVLLHMTTQIASAMKYLASHNFVHRDLATRNCLVGQNYLVKIADFGMSRNLYESHYYRIHGRVILPVRWMATECFYGKFSQKTDVWAFGITVWEIFSLAKEPPLKELCDQEVVQDAIKGANRKLLDKPKSCPSEVYEIMLKCWAAESSSRASFEELYGLLSAINKD